MSNVNGLRQRLAGAPITWGVCEVPDWGVQLPPDRVLREIAEVGLTATELGPDGFLPGGPEAVRELLAGHGLRLAAGFVPSVLHRPDRLDMELAEVERQARTLAGAGADVLVLAASTGGTGYEVTAELDEAGWQHLTEGIARVEDLAARYGLTTALHPHYGTLIERAEHVEAVLERSAVGLCIDVGHLLVGGADPVEVTRAALHRIRHVHLKDVDARVAAQVRAGELSYREAVAAGLYRVLGRGDVDIATIVRLLEEDGYGGWYVLEQDTVLDADPVGPHGPVADAAASVAYLEEQVSAA